MGLPDSTAALLTSSPSLNGQDAETAPRRKVSLNKSRQTKYWLRCLKTYLPTAYQANDSQRLSLAFFILCALDLLDELQKNTSEDERNAYIGWIYHCQHPDGGFRGSTSTAISPLGPQHEAFQHAKIYNDPSGQHWDPANLGATFFALAALIILRDGLQRVKRRETLHWLKGLQRPDGAFGEARGKNGSIEGGGDVRFCYLAAGVRWMLRSHDERGLAAVDEDINVGDLVEYIVQSTTFEGGIAEAPLHEAQAGETYCGIGALKLLGHLPPESDSQQTEFVANSRASLDKDFIDRVIRWLLHRQTTYIQDMPENENYDDALSDGDECDSREDSSVASKSSFSIQATRPASTELHPMDSIIVPPEQPVIAGFNGRANKLADTCYAWWVGGTLGILNKSHLQDYNAVERYLLETTQHLMGGFSKSPGDPPDILHSCLGLAALAAMRHPDLKRINPTLCVSVQAMEEFEERRAG